MITRRKSLRSPKRLRALAEALLRKTPRKATPASAGHTEKLVHELQVHQIELEMQNDELRRTQLELEAARERLLLPYDAAPVGFLTLDAAGVIHEANLAAAQLLNFDRVKLAGQKLTRFIAPESQDAFYLHRRALFDSGERQACELRLARPGDTQPTVKLESIMEHAGEGLEARCLVMLSDITEQRWALGLLRESEERYRTLFSTLIEGFCIIEVLFDDANQPVDYRFLEMNPAFETQTGLQNAQGKLMRELAPGHEAHWFEIYGQVALTGEPVRFVNEARALGRWYDVSAYRVGGPESRKVAILFNDITEQHRAEEKLRESERRERQRAEELAALIETIPTPVIIVHDPDARHMTGNRAADKLLRIPHGTEISLSAPDQLKPAHFKVFKDGRELRPDELPAQRAARGETVMDFELKLVFNDGTARTLLCYGTPLLDEQGQPRGAVHTLVDITEHKQAEERLREQADLLEVAHDAIMVREFNGTIAFWNYGASEMYGYAKKEAIGRNSRELLRTVFPKPLAEIEAGLARQGRWEGELIHTRNDGTTIVVASRWVLQMGNNGRPGRVLEINSDITERKRAEEALQRVHDKLEQRVHERTVELTRTNAELQEEKAFSESLIELAPAMVVVLDRKGRLIRTNAYAERLTGYPFTETKGRNVLEMFVSKEQQPRMRRLLKQVLEGLPALVVAPLRLKDGSIRQIEWFAKAVGSGKKAAVLALGHDITERKQAEEALRRSEHELTDFFDHAPIGLLWVKPNGHMLRVNQALTGLLGTDDGDILQRPVARLFVDPEAVNHMLRQLAEGQMVQNYHLRLRQKDRSIKHVLVDANGFWEDGKLTHSRWFVRDITRRIELEREILSISEREQQRMGHDLHDDLCQQLASIEFLSYTLAKKTLVKDAAEQAKEIAQMARNAMSQTRELAHGLSPVALEADGLTTALQALARRTSKVFRLDCRFRCPKPVLLSDHAVGTHLYRIAQEAVRNAIKHGKARRIDLGLTANGKNVVLAVKDNGLGIPLKKRKHGGMGLRIMQYRAGIIGGSLIVQRNTNGDTTVVCTVTDGLMRKSKED